MLMASVRLLIFLFTFVFLRGGVADGRSYPVSTPVAECKEMEKDIMKKMERIRVKEVDGCRSSPSTIDSSDNLYKKKKKSLNVKYKWVNKSHGGHLPNDKGSRFIAFNADYFVAKPHPPKNNGGKYL
ncbi:hypothetical protein E5676_scaffold248G001660 [Cucumis melo var. makuwa]|uniref:Uncharacterized protein n=1 Tax=Cucumis melo var. makuwa TaxID=1194695 RepID=A0A5D3BI53_CUCMM|nr:hypothetical protein E5676_scaffold248G001660 [Cucumis melo var. makuwa]